MGIAARNALCAPLAGWSSVRVRIFLRSRQSTYQSSSFNALLAVPKPHGSARMIPPKGILRRVMKRAISSRPKRTKLSPGRFLVRPYALSGSRRELFVAGLCILVLGAIFIAEILTPDVVLSAFALLPLLAAIWVLSSRFAAVVTIAAILFFGLAVATEAANRTTVIFVGVAVLATALITRLYATALASLLSSRRRMGPPVATSATPATLDGIGRSSYGVQSLTRRELEVARMAAEGHTASEIGRLLNIGDRTVESHLASAYSKLQIRSRLQLIRMAPGLGGPPSP
jgi:DNA-binding CsgD family transcriptional regulator